MIAVNMWLPRKTAIGMLRTPEDLKAIRQLQSRQGLLALGLDRIQVVIVRFPFLVIHALMFSRGRGAGTRGGFPV